jgi:hypothetical protein
LFLPQLRYEARYDQLENPIGESGMSASDVEKTRECLRTIKKRYLVESKEEQAQLDQQLVEFKFNIY